jgi:B9 domain-containing protein 2
MIEVWRVDEHGRHNIYGYGTVALPMASGSHILQIPCWRPMGSWYDRFIGANSELQYPDIVASSLSKYGLRTFSGCLVEVELDLIGRNFHLHGVLR